MRLPWPFRRSDPEAGPPASVADGVPQRLAAPVRHDWRAAGTLRPSFKGDPGIRAQRFSEEIAGSQLPSPILAPLGHARTADGPAGLVSGLARPTLTRTVSGVGGRVDLPLRPGRPARHIQRSSSLSASDPGESHVAPALPDGPPAELALVSPLGAVPAAMPVLEPRRVAVATTPAPAYSASLTVARTPELTLAPAPARRAATSVVARVVEQGVPVAATAGPGTAVGTSTRTILRTASGSRVRLGAPIQRFELATGAPSLELAHPASRGSNAVSATPAPATTSIQRHASPEADRHAAGAPDHDVADAPLTGRLSMTIHDGPTAPPATEIEMAPRIPGGLVLARTVASSQAGQTIDRPTVADPDDARPPAPLVGRASVAPVEPLRPTIPAPNAVPTATVEARSHTSPGAARRSTAQRSAIVRTAVGQPPSRTSTVAGGGALPGPDVATPMMRSAVRAPAEPVRPAAQAVTQGPPASLVRTTRMVADVNEPRSAARRPALATHATVQRATDDQPTDPDEPSTSASASLATPGGEPSVADSLGPSPGGPSAATPIADRDLDEMVRRLYPRLRRSLSSELLVARERAGTLADVR